MGSLLFKTETAKQRFRQVLRALDSIAAKDQLAFLTTQRVSRESGISDGVLFRHFASKDVMVESWIDQRAQQLRLLLEAMPGGRSGLMYVVQQLLKEQSLLSFLCCQPVDTPYLRQQLDASRAQFYRVMLLRIELLSSAPVGVAPEVLTDHLVQKIYRAWNPANTGRDRQKELLMSQLPWESIDKNKDMFPDRDVLQRLALNDSGFVFDPLNGRSFSANDVGLYVLRFLQQSDDVKALMVSVSRDFDVKAADAQRDVTEFSGQLRKLLA
ncbi:MAG: PqqD family peptide modification chaperone [Mariprofundus sp.]|nr:PqqD family peptide modification chaperone [Mariprofundus sp.]